MPPPVSGLAASALVEATRLEDTIDAITAPSTALDAGEEATELVGTVESALDALGRGAGPRASR